MYWPGKGGRSARDHSRLSTPPASQAAQRQRPQNDTQSVAAAPTAAAAGAPRRRALRSVAACVRFAGVAATGLALDLWSKHWAFHTLGQGAKPRVIIPHLLEFQTMLNKGALFGIGGGRTALFLVASIFALVLVLWMFAQTSLHRRALHVALGAILAGALGNMYDRIFVKLLEQPHRFSNGQYAYLIVTGSSQAGTELQVYPPRPGAPAIILPSQDVPPQVGFVRDFIKIPTTLPQWSWIPARIRGRELWPWVFNVADMLLVGGVGSLAIHLWRDRRHTRTPRCAAAAASRPA